MFAQGGKTIALRFAKRSNDFTDPTNSCKEKPESKPTPSVSDKDTLYNLLPNRFAYATHAIGVMYA